MKFYTDKKCREIIEFCAEKIPEVEIEIFDYDRKMAVDEDSVCVHHSLRGYVVEAHYYLIRSYSGAFRKRDDFLYTIINCFSTPIAYDYTKDFKGGLMNRQKVILDKELEIFARFGEDLRHRKYWTDKKYSSYVY